MVTFQMVYVRQPPPDFYTHMCVIELTVQKFFFGYRRVQKFLVFFGKRITNEEIDFESKFIKKVTKKKLYLR